jgi:hypothetical protein
MVKNVAHISYHIIVVLLSAAIALSMPVLVSAAARKLLTSWTLIENEKIFLAVLEISTAVVLIILFNYVRRAWKDRRLSRMARNAGLVLVAPLRGFLVRQRVKRLKEEQAFAREIMLICSTGFQTFAAPEGDLHQAVQNSREAKIMLLDPLGEGATTRAKSIPDPEITPEVVREQIIKSIEFLKGLKASQKSIRLKLYPDLPLLKLAILGDYVFLRHYHIGKNVRDMPEYVFKNDKNQGGLYIPLYRYFLSRWNDPNIPEYDLGSDELVHRDAAGNEVKREKFGLPSG